MKILILFLLLLGGFNNKLNHCVEQTLSNNITNVIELTDDHLMIYDIYFNNNTKVTVYQRFLPGEKQFWEMTIQGECNDITPDKILHISQYQLNDSNLFRVKDMCMNWRCLKTTK